MLTLTARSLALLPLLAPLAAAQHDHDEDAPPPAPRLVLQITVDQLRADLVHRYRHRFGEGGFRRLMSDGAQYVNAHHAHANTETIVGHTTLATGAHPATHGMVGNLWMERGAGVAHYNVEDAQFPVLSTKPLIDQDTEIDPTQRAARSDGRSPRSIKVSTFGDELTLFTGGHAKVFGVSVKDRGAIAMAGHTGTAYWFSKTTGEFVTSSYYRDDYPEWAAQWNGERIPYRYSGNTWQLAREQSNYVFGDRDDRPFETDVAGFGRTFPHPYGKYDGKYFNTFLTLSPAGDELTVDFMKRLVIGEELGQDDVCDYLSISLSSTDYVGHVFGPSSLEAEDNLLRLDDTIGEILTFIQAAVGLQNTLVVLSADHGGPEAPDYLAGLGFEADYITTSDEMRAAATAAIVERFGEGEDLIQGFFHPYVYLDHGVAAARGLDVAEVSRVVAAALETQPGIAHAYTAEACRTGQLPDTRVARAVAHNFHPARSGEVYVVTAPDHFVNDFDGLTVAATHGSPWRYDTHVPIFFMNPAIAPQQIQREVFTIDIAPTLALFLGTKLPSGCDGQPLEELFW